MTATTSSPSTAIAVPEPVFTRQEQLALAGFLAGYTGLTREAYARSRSARRPAPDMVAHGGDRRG